MLPTVNFQTPTMGHQNQNSAGETDKEASEGVVETEVVEIKDECTNKTVGSQSAEVRPGESGNNIGAETWGFVSARTLLVDESKENILSPGFRSVAALAGWDDEALLLASFDPESLETLIVEDSPVRESPVRESRERKKREARTPGLAQTPASARRRNRRARTENIDPIDLNRVGALSLEDDPVVERNELKHVSPAQPAQGVLLQGETSIVVTENNDQPSAQPGDAKAESSPDKRKKGFRKPAEPSPDKSQKGSTKPAEPSPDKSQKGSTKPAEPSPAKSEKGSSGPTCMEQLREELSCAVCLDICFEPSTTCCGHSFCKMCLENVIEKCGSRCPKCRQPLRGDFHACPINTVLWNTVQLLFPKEVAERIKAKKERDDALKLEWMKQKANSYTNQANRGGALRNIGSNWQGHPTTQIGLSRPANFRRAFQSVARSSQESEGEVTIVANAGRDEGAERGATSLEEELDAALASRLQQEELMRSFRGGGGGRRNRGGGQTTRDRPADQRRTVSSAAANLRAMASRAIRARVRNQ